MTAQELARNFTNSELSTDYFKLSMPTVKKLARLANKYSLGKNNSGRANSRQLWYSIQNTQKQ